MTFVRTTIPYRIEWRYGIAAHKVIALDAGHVCRNLYLASAAIGGGVAEQSLFTITADQIAEITGTSVQ